MNINEKYYTVYTADFSIKFFQTPYNTQVIIV